MAQNDQIVVGIDVAKDKVDACMRSLLQRHTFPNTAQGRRKMIAWLHTHKVNKAVMEASGGNERDWARVLRLAGIEVRLSIPSGSAALHCRPGGWQKTIRSTPR